MSLRSELNEWRDTLPPNEKGCGCAALVAVGLLAFARMAAADFGDYVGPRKEAEAHFHEMNVIMLVSLCVFVLCTFVGSWLVRKPRRNDGA